MAQTVTLTADQLAALISEAVAEHTASQKATKAAERPNTIVDPATDRRPKTDSAVVRAFKRAGYGDVVPRKDVCTFNVWLRQGYRVRPGEKSVKVAQWRLFHRSQVQWEGIPPKPEAPTEAETAAAKPQTAPPAPQQVAAPQPTAKGNKRQRQTTVQPQPQG